MNVSTVKELIVVLNQIEDKSLPIRLVNQQVDGDENIWLNRFEISETGQSGYELKGEVRLLGNE